MINIYVDELPKSCKECKCAFNTFRQRVNETGSYMEECMCCIPLNEWLVEKHPNCPLKPLSVALAEERKKVVQEIRDLAGDYFEMPYCDACGNTDFNDVVLTGKDLTEILDDVERGEL